MKLVSRLAALVLTALSIAAPRAAEPADTVYRHGRIYTVDTERRWVEAVAIKAGRFVAVGSDADIAPHIGPATRVVDLAGRMAMPGIHDMHMHPIEGGFQALIECTFPFTTSTEDVVRKVAACAANKPKG